MFADGGVVPGDRCEKCGAPMTMFMGAWGCILPPPKYHTCNCFPGKHPVYTSATQTISLNDAMEKLDNQIKLQWPKLQ